MKIFKFLWKLILVAVVVAVVIFVLDVFLGDDSPEYEGSDYSEYDYNDSDYDDNYGHSFGSKPDNSYAYEDEDYSNNSSNSNNSSHHITFGNHTGSSVAYNSSSSSNNNSNDDVYSDYDDYGEDSWSVSDYLFSFLGDDYGYDDSDYDSYSGSSSGNYSNNYDDEDDYEYEEEYTGNNSSNSSSNAVASYSPKPSSTSSNTSSNAATQTSKPTVTTTSSGNTSTQQNVTPVSVSTQRKSFIEYALSLKGTPYVYGGKTPSPGIDCSGLVAFAARKAISVNFTGSAQNMYNNAKSVSMDSAEPGDLVFFSDSGNGITHVGIYLGKNSGQGANNQRMFVHSASEGSSTGVIVSSLDQSNYWSKHLVGTKSFLSTSKEVRSFNRSGNKKSTTSSQEDFDNDSWWDDVDASWFEN